MPLTSRMLNLATFGPVPVAVGFDNYSQDLMPFVLPDADAPSAAFSGRESVGELVNKSGALW